MKFSHIIQMAVLIRYISQEILQYVLIQILNKTYLGDNVDLSVVTPPEGNSTVIIDTTNLNNNMSSIYEQNIDNVEDGGIDPNIDFKASPPSNSNEIQKTSISITSNNDIEEINAKEHVNNIENKEKSPVIKDNTPTLPLQGVVLRHHERFNLLERPAAFDKGLNSKNKVQC
jgi:hypothetical protein